MAVMKLVTAMVFLGINTVMNALTMLGVIFGSLWGKSRKGSDKDASSQTLSCEIIRAQKLQF